MPVKSTYPDIDIPQVDLWKFLFDRKQKPFQDHKVLYVDSNTRRSYNYESVKQAALDFGKGLRAIWDWKKGDVLALYTPNSIDTPPIMWGTLWAGGVISPANPAYTVDELVHQLKDSGSKAICTQYEFLPIVTEAAKIAGIEKDRIILMGDKRTTDGSFKHFTSIRNISGAIRFKKPVVKHDDLALLVYSSGTTGLPKGVMLSHKNIISNTLQLCTVESELSCTGGATGNGDVVLAFLPFFHIYGLTCLIMNACYRGLELVVMPKFEIENFCQVIEHFKVTFIYLVPPVALLLSKHPCVSKYDLSSLRMANSGAAPLTRDLIEGVYKRIGLRVKQGYGLSETSPTTHTQTWKEWDKPVGSVGRMLPNILAKYLNEKGEEVETGQVGELALKGPNVFIGYLNKPELTKQCFTSDGYFLTGDIGYQDENGKFFITDRVKELIKYKGFQVAPAELEGVLVGHPKIDDAAVIGIQNNELATELPRAYVKVASGVKSNDKTAKEIFDYVSAKVASHKRLRGGIFFVADIPKSPSGKILRRLLKEQAKKDDASVKAKL